MDQQLKEQWDKIDRILKEKEFIEQESKAKINQLENKYIQKIGDEQSDDITFSELLHMCQAEMQTVNEKLKWLTE